MKTKKTQEKIFVSKKAGFKEKIVKREKELQQAEQHVEQKESADLEKREQVKEYIEEHTPEDEAITAQGVPIAQKGPYSESIETVLEEDLDELYEKLPKSQRAEFKKQGEILTGRIEKMLQSAKLNLKRIQQMIKQWLLMIPGVNKFFLEQEAKIKTDKIVAIKEEEDRQIKGGQ